MLLCCCVVVLSCCRVVVVSLCRCVVVSLCRCVVVSLCRCVVVSLRCCNVSFIRAVVCHVLSVVFHSSSHYRRCQSKGQARLDPLPSQDPSLDLAASLVTLHCCTVLTPREEVKEKGEFILKLQQSLAKFVLAHQHTDCRS